MPGNADLSRINALPLLKTGGCAQIVGRQGDLLATAREARLAADARDAADARHAGQAGQATSPAAAPSRRWRLGWRFPFLSAAR
jgi:hypothetical protein